MNIQNHSSTFYFIVFFKGNHKINKKKNKNSRNSKLMTSFIEFIPRKTKKNKMGIEKKQETK